MNRSQKIIRTSVIGIVANVLLAAFKAVVGILASSVAIVMDAVTNLSDALSSVITISGTKLSERPAALTAQLKSEIEALVPGEAVTVVIDHNYSE